MHSPPVGCCVLKQRISRALRHAVVCCLTFVNKGIAAKHPVPACSMHLIPLPPSLQLARPYKDNIDGQAWHTLASASAARVLRSPYYGAWGLLLRGMGTSVPVIQLLCAGLPCRTCT